MKPLAPFRGTLLRLALTNAFLVGLVALGLMVFDDARRQRARTLSPDSGHIVVGAGLRAPARAAPSDFDQRFIQDAVLLVSEELHVAELGSRRATRAETRRFAKELAAQQVRVRNEIEQLAAKKGILLPTSDVRAAGTDRVVASRGEEFDANFAEWAKTRHSDGIRLFERAAEGCSDGELRRFAERVVPMLKSQHEHARRLTRAVF